MFLKFSNRTLQPIFFKFFVLFPFTVIILNLFSYCLVSWSNVYVADEFLLFIRQYAAGAHTTLRDYNIVFLFIKQYSYVLCMSTFQPWI